MRLEITRKSHLAISAMKTLAEVGDRVSGKKLAGAIETSVAFLAQVMTPLVQEGWVTSQPGRSGGYELAIDPRTVSVLQVIEAVEGPTDTETCVLRLERCSASEPCVAHAAWSRARGAFLDQLSATPLSILSPEELRR
jgi:Rrf2 family iron-sulfur cluster assembly transcriptional regulator